MAKKRVSSVRIRHKKVADILVGNGGNVSGAMREAGYSAAYSDHPEKLVNTKSWAELMDEYLPDDFLADKHRKLINTPITVRLKRVGEATQETRKMDTDSVARGLEMAYKLKGRYTQHIKHDGTINVRDYSESEKISLDKYASTDV